MSSWSWSKVSASLSLLSASKRQDREHKILANSIEESLKKLGHCQLCNNFTEEGYMLNM